MFKRILGIVLIGIVIKLMDDYLDHDLDKLREENNLYFLLHRAILPYSLILMLIALYLNFNEVTALFAASYSLGMVYELNKKLPDGLRGWQETLLIFFLSIYITNFFNTIAAFVLIILLQIIDDFRDYQSDIEIGSENYVSFLGKNPALFLSGILILISIKYFPVKLICFTSGVLLVYIILFLVRSFYFGKITNIFSTISNLFN